MFVIVNELVGTLRILTQVIPSDCVSGICTNNVLLIHKISFSEEDHGPWVMNSEATFKSCGVSWCVNINIHKFMESLF